MKITTRRRWSSCLRNKQAGMPTADRRGRGDLAAGHQSDGCAEGEHQGRRPQAGGGQHEIARQDGGQVHEDREACERRKPPPADACPLIRTPHRFDGTIAFTGRLASMRRDAAFALVREASRHAASRRHQKYRRAGGRRAWLAAACPTGDRHGAWSWRRRMTLPSSANGSSWSGPGKPRQASRSGATPPTRSPR